MSLYTDYRDEILSLLHNNDWGIGCNKMPDMDIIGQFELEIDMLTEGRLLNYIKTLGETTENYADKVSFYENVITMYCQHKIKTQESLQFYFQFYF